LMLLVAAPPCVKASVAGLAVIVNEGGATTVSISRAVLAKFPAVPVTVIVAFPGAAALLAVNVSVLVVTALVGLNAAVIPVGRPDRDRATGPEKPF
jgi:hypothetical protein